MKLSENQQVFTRNIAALIQFATAHGYGLTFGHAWRSLDDQLRLVEKGYSKTMESLHLKRLAVDFNVFIDGSISFDWNRIKLLGDYWESLHPKNKWGGDWNNNNIEDGFIDTSHFQMEP